jgi:DNA mismatch endonuclease (patch repair protein)
MHDLRRRSALKRQSGLRTRGTVVTTMAQWEDGMKKSERGRFMAAIRTRGTAPELAIRKLLFGTGVKRVYNSVRLPGRPDLAFPQLRKVIFVHGCFWHRHTGCKKATLPRTNRHFWLRKLERNVQRDAEQRKSLRENGWRSLVVWECETRDTAKITRSIIRFLKA